MFTVNDDYRPSVFWSMNDALDRQQLEKQMDLLLEQGLNCGFFHSRVGLVTPYMSKEWLDAFVSVCAAAGMRDTRLWMYDEDRWPSGYGGGEVTRRHPELASKALFLVPRNEIDGQRFIRSLGTVKRNGKAYLFALYKQLPSAWYCGSCYPDVLDFRTIPAFTSLIHEKYAQSASEYFGNVLRGIFFDEPCYTYRGKYPGVPFTEDLPAAFEKHYGYSLLDCLHQLFFDEGEYHQVRLDFYTLITKRFVDAFTVQYQKWCTDHNLLLTGHYLHEDTLTAQTESIGAAMPHYAKMDMPGIDILGLGNENLATVLQVTSIAEQLDKPCVCEALGCIGHQSGPEAMKGVTDWLNVLGISLINPHLTLYSMRGERKRDYPPNISWLQPWYTAAKPYFDHVARVSETVRRGTSTTSVLLLHPISSVWAEISPLHRKHKTSSIWAPFNPNGRQNFNREVECWQKPFMDLTTRLYGQQTPHHYGDELVMVEHGTVVEKELRIGRQGYRLVIVPPVQVLRASTVKLLRALGQQTGGDSVVFVEHYPDWIAEDDGQDWEFPTWSRLAETVEEVLEIAKPNGLQHICMHGVGIERVFVNERINDSGYTTFLANTGTYPVDLKVQWFGSTPPKAVDTMTGEWFTVPCILANQGYELRVSLKTYGSLLLAETSEEGKVAGYLQSGVDFRSSMVLKGQQHPAGCLRRENILPLDVVTFRTNTFTREDTPVEWLWPQYYALADGTPFQVEYMFWLDEIPTCCYARAEMARNMESVSLNGQPAYIEKIADEDGIFDFSFDRIALINLRKGKNLLQFKGNKCNNIIGMATHRSIGQEENHRPTELENVFLCGEFHVELTRDHPVIMRPQSSRVIGDITGQGYPFYTGELTYTVEIPPFARWLFVDADAAACRVITETQTLTSLISPFEFDLEPLIAAGVKSITIELMNTLANSFGPLHLRNRDMLKMLGPTMIYDQSYYQKKPVLIPYGLQNLQFFG